MWVTWSAHSLPTWYRAISITYIHAESRKVSRSDLIRQFRETIRDHCNAPETVQFKYGPTG